MYIYNNFELVTETIDNLYSVEKMYWKQKDIASTDLKNLSDNLNYLC